MHGCYFLSFFSTSYYPRWEYTLSREKDRDNKSIETNCKIQVNRGNAENES